MSNIKIAGILDTETTGLNHYIEEVIELSFILFSFDYTNGRLIEVLDYYTGLREPRVPIKKNASYVHGLYKNDVKGKELDYNKISSLIDRADLIISHNAQFDYYFAIKLFPKFQTKPWYCSMNGINWRNEGFSSKGLQNLLAAHGIKVKRSHRAADDAWATLELISKESKYGYTYLSKIIRKPMYLPPAAAKSIKEAAATGENIFSNEN